jgi:hypothetical protein
VIRSRAGPPASSADDEVLPAQARQPQRLGQREAQHAAEAGGQRALLERPDAQRLGGQAQRHAARPAHQVGRVGVERVKVDDGEGRLEPRCGAVQRPFYRFREKVHRFGGSHPLRDVLECRAEHGT